MNDCGECALGADGRVERREKYTRLCEALRSDCGGALLGGAGHVKHEEIHNKHDDAYENTHRQDEHGCQSCSGEISVP